MLLASIVITATIITLVAFVTATVRTHYRECTAVDLDS